MTKYQMYYTTYNNLIVDDIVYADNKIDAIKEFIKRNKGNVLIYKCEVM